MNFRYPITDILDNIFHINQGHQITDEELYNSQGEIPVYTGANVIKGYWNKSIIPEIVLPCLTYATKAFDGVISLQEEVFDANNTAVLYLKDTYKDVVLIEWAQYILPNILLKARTSKGGVSYLNREIIKDLSIAIPSKDMQAKQIQIFGNLTNSLNKIKEIVELYNDLITKNIICDYKDYQDKDVHIQKCFDYIGGNSGLTEEVIYQTLQMDGTRYNVLSSATEGKNNMGNVVEFQIKGKPIKTYTDSDGLLVIRKGKAGATRYLPKGNWTINDDAYILYVKSDCKYMIDLRWFRIQYKNKFLEFASSSDNGTWNMTGFFNHTYVDIPSHAEQLRIVELYRMVENKYNDLCLLVEKYESLLLKEIVF